jgi:hypothetical protein
LVGGRPIGRAGFRRTLALNTTLKALVVDAFNDPLKKCERLWSVQAYGFGPTDDM